MINYRPDVAIIVLTRNAGLLWNDWITAIKKQTVIAGKYLVIDTCSHDGTALKAKMAGFEVVDVLPEQFDHGGTRQLAAQLCPDADYLVYLTQDAILTQTDSLEQLLEPFADEKMAQVYGRHVPRESADLLEQHARQFTYHSRSETRAYQHVKERGFKAAFSSDVYSAYRSSALRSIGGFPQKIIVSEDSYVSARLLQAGWKIRYSAESEVEHSHHYVGMQLFRRYFDIGVFHANEECLFQQIGKPEGEGIRYLQSQIQFVLQHKPYLLVKALLQTLIKYIAFKAGKRHASMPLWLKIKLSAQKAYWHTPQTASMSQWAKYFGHTGAAGALSASTEPPVDMELSTNRVVEETS
jgi:rhamnosyltransferase